MSDYNNVARELFTRETAGLLAATAAVSTIVAVTGLVSVGELTAAALFFTGGVAVGRTQGPSQAAAKKSLAANTCG